ncbi:transcriptional regulator [Zobellella endophytica]|uniref:Transcriptional regulator n=1 Tax=Zobellella endophytica TaxID=2116700 RepID=A0A2P7RCJ7_9GAMM|nr:transcriptional regulator [Zobellella endophytica]PSJ47954.1 transcriptional regulator [Zobellella endophytica]
MKFSLLIAIVPEELEQRCIDAAKEAGAGGVTIMGGRGIGSSSKKTFFGLTYEGTQSILLMVLEKNLSLHVLKAIQTELIVPPSEKDQGQSKGVVLTLPLEHLGGIEAAQLEQFERYIKDEF